MDCKKRSCINYKLLKEYYEQEPDGTCPDSCAECSKFYPNRYERLATIGKPSEPKPSTSLLKAFDDINNLDKKQTIQIPTDIPVSENLNAFWDRLDDRTRERK